MITLYIFHLSLSEISLLHDLMKFCLKKDENKEKSCVNHMLVFEIFARDITTNNCFNIVITLFLKQTIYLNNKLRNLVACCDADVDLYE